MVSVCTEQSLVLCWATTYSHWTDENTEKPYPKYQVGFDKKNTGERNKCCTANLLWWARDGKHIGKRLFHNFSHSSTVSQLPADIVITLSAPHPTPLYSAYTQEKQQERWEKREDRTEMYCICYSALHIASSRLWCSDCTGWATPVTCLRLFLSHSLNHYLCHLFVVLFICPFLSTLSCLRTHTH